MTATLAGALPGPKPTRGQTDGLTALELAARATASPFLEEFVLTGAVVTLLLAARRPSWEIYTVAALGRLLPHGYFGMHALGSLVISLATVWPYRRSGRLTWLIAAHVTHNLTAAFGPPSGPSSSPWLLSSCGR